MELRGCAHTSVGRREDATSLACACAATGVASVCASRRKRMGRCGKQSTGMQCLGLGLPTMFAEHFAHASCCNDAWLRS